MSLEVYFGYCTVQKVMVLNLKKKKNRRKTEIFITKFYFAQMDSKRCNGLFKITN